MFWKGLGTVSWKKLDISGLVYLWNQKSLIYLIDKTDLIN